MRLVFGKKSSDKLKSRAKKRIRIRKKIFGTTERPRLTVFKSANHIYAQVIDDASGKTLVEASTITVEAAGKVKPVEAAKLIGAEIAKKAKEKKVSAVVFDRSGYMYHGRIKALADAARESGLQF